MLNQLPDSLMAFFDYFFNSKKIKSLCLILGVSSACFFSGIICAWFFLDNPPKNENQLALLSSSDLGLIIKYKNRHLQKSYPAKMNYFDAVRLSGEKEPKPLAKSNENIRLKLKIKGSLYHSLLEKLKSRDAQVSSALISRLLSFKIKLRSDLLKGDELKAVIQKNGSEIKILALSLKSQKFKRNIQFFRYQSSQSKFPKFYDGKGVQIEKLLVNSPLKDYEEITALLGDERKHNGVDFKAPTGTKVYSPYAGKIIKKNWRTRKNGYCLKIKHPSPKVETLYLHLNSIAKGLKKGSKVKAGQVIGTVGSTGRSFGPHLHYQMMRANRVLDPFKIQKTYKRSLVAIEHETFLQYKQKFFRPTNMVSQMDPESY